MVLLYTKLFDKLSQAGCQRYYGLINAVFWNITRNILRRELNSYLNTYNKNALSSSQPRSHRMRHTLSRYRSSLQALFFFCLLFPAAAIAKVPTSNFIDNGRTTFDRTTGLEWLDLTETAGIPYLEVSDRLAQ